MAELHTERRAFVKEFRTIGGTAISAIIGENPYENRRGIYFKLRRETPDQPDNSAMERGRDFEDIIAQSFGVIHKNEFTVYHNDAAYERNRDDWEKQQFDIDSNYDFITGSPDRLLYPANVTEEQFKEGPIAGLEIKTASIRNYEQWGMIGTDAIPIHYYCQCLWYLGLRPSIQEWHVAVLFFDYDNRPCRYQEYVICRNTQTEKFIEGLREEGIKFWNEHILPGIEPTVDADDYGTVIEYVKERNKVETEPLEEGTAEEQDIFERWRDCKDDIKRLQDELCQIEAELIEKIGAKAGLYFPNVDGTENMVTRKVQERKTVAWKKVAEASNASQEIIDAHTTTSSNRVLRIGKYRI